MSARNTFAATRRSHAILRWLQNGEAVTIQRVCNTFKIQYPQAREDLKLLEELYGLSTHREGRTKTWTWNGPEQAIKSVAAAAALELGAIALDMFRDTPYGEEIDKISRECRRALNKENDERVERLSSSLYLRRTWLPVNAEEMLECIEEILDAIYLEHLLAVDYERSDGSIRSYKLKPHRLIWYSGRLWLQASDEALFKLFDVAGIQSIARVDHDLALPDGAGGRKSDGAISSGKRPGDGYDKSQVRSAMLSLAEAPVEQYFANAFGIFADNYPVASVRLQVSGSWATYFRRYYVHPSQKNVEKDGTLHVHLKLGVCPEFKSFLMGMIPHVRVLEPKELRTELRERAAMGAAL